MSFPRTREPMAHRFIPRSIGSRFRGSGGLPAARVRRRSDLHPPQSQSDPADISRPPQFFRRHRLRDIDGHGFLRAVGLELQENLMLQRRQLHALACTTCAHDKFLAHVGAECLHGEKQVQAPGQRLLEMQPDLVVV